MEIAHENDPRARLGLDSQTMFGMNPLEQIALAAELGCGHVSLAPLPVPWKLERFGAWSLRDDPQLRREAKAALRDTGVRVAVAEGFTIRPNLEAADRAADMDIMADLGAAAIGAVSMGCEPARALEQMSVLAALAEERAMTFLFEFAPPHTFNTLDTAIEAVRSLRQPNARLLVDTMHFFRTGSDTASLLPVGELIGYVQLSDAPMSGPGTDYYLEASFERLLPGIGELPLTAFLAAIPEDVRIGLEIPMQRAMTEAVDLREPIGRMVDAAASLLSELGTLRSAPTGKA